MKTRWGARLAMVTLLVAARTDAQEWIAFTGTFGDSCGTYAVSTAGGAVQTLYRNTDYGYWCPYGYAVWSPDGRRVTFKADMRDGVHDRQLFSVEAPDGGPIAWLTDNPAFTAVRNGWSFSHDGMRIALAGDDVNLDLGIFTMPAAGGPATMLVPREPNTYAVSPVFSPDDTQVAYVRSTWDPATGITTTSLNIVPAVGGAVRMLAEDQVAPAGQRDLDWAPSGTFIAALSPTWFNGSIYGRDVETVDVATGAVTNLSSQGYGECRGPQVSPDSTKIAAICGTQLVVFPVDGSVPIVLWGDTGGYNASWSPDGSALAFAYGADYWARGIARAWLDGTIEVLTDPVFQHLDGVGYQPSVAPTTSIRIETASYDYVRDALTVIVHTARGANDEVSVVGFGPLTYTASRWQGTFPTPTPPTRIAICAIDGCVYP